MFMSMCGVPEPVRNGTPLFLPLSTCDGAYLYKHIVEPQSSGDARATYPRHMATYLSYLSNLAIPRVLPAALNADQR